MKKGAYGVVYQDITRNKDISAAAKGLYAYLSAFCGSNDECYPTVDMITKEMSMTKDTFYKHVNALVSAGVVEKRQTRIEGNKFGRTIYRVTHEVHISDFPFPKKSITEDSITEMSISENSETNNNNINNNIINNNKKNNIICPESVKQTPDPSGIQIPLNDKTFYDVPLSKIRSWGEAYPAVDVRAELLKMKAWSESNPKRAKTRKGITRFINSWLSKEQDSGGRYRRQSATYKPSTEEQARLNRESYEQQEKEYQEWKRQQEEYKLLHRNDPVEEDSIWG